MRRAPLLTVLAAIGLGHSAVQLGGPRPRALVLELHALEAVRDPRPFFAQLTVHHPGEVAGDLELEELRVEADGEVLWIEPLGLTLQGDPEYGRLQSLIERLPAELACRHGAGAHNGHDPATAHHDHAGHERVYSLPGEPLMTMAEGLDAIETLPRRILAMQEDMGNGGPVSFVQPSFLLPADQMLAQDAPAGAEVDYRIVLRYRTAGGSLEEAVVERSLVRLAPLMGLPGGNQLTGGGLSIWDGDLHVHSCHGEAAGACAPSDNCTAESFQLSGSFSYAELKTQYQALGMDWFTSTDHSYCVDTDAEYAAVVSECAAITDGSFLAIPDMELSSEEEGPQVGSDVGDLLCLLGPSANHMGAHGISSRIYGGDSGLLGFCNGLFSDALNGFQGNIGEVNAQGGYAIANHPDGGSFGWNSRALTVGQEAGGLHGVEVWNGSLVTGQGGNVGAWVDWMLDGRRLYGYSGSDTHDEAFDFGANRAVVDGPLTIAGVEGALRAGRCFMSNGPALVIEADLGGVTIPMGSVQSVPSSPPAQPVRARALLNTGLAGTVTLFAGAVGDSSETVLLTQSVGSGVNVLEADLPLTGAERQWVRAYFEAGDGSQAAYTNPIFFEALEPGTTGVTCIARPDPLGCEPSLSWQGSASAGSGFGFLVSASDVRNQTFGIPVWSLSSAQLPFFGGTLCVGNPLRRGAVQTTGGQNGLPDCSGSLSVDFNQVIASGTDPSLVVGETVHLQFWYRNVQATPSVGLTSALQFTIGQ